MNEAYTNRAEASYRFLKCWRAKNAGEVALNSEASVLDVSHVTLLPPVQYSDAPLKAGQIRLLPGGEEMVEVLLYKQQEGTWIVIPLSSIPYPATEMEATFREENPYGPRTYCLWGWMEYPTIVLRCRSWLIGEVTSKELYELSTLMCGFFAGQELSENKLSRCGVKIEYPFDERLEYETKTGELHQSVLAYGNSLKREATLAEVKRFLKNAKYNDFAYAAATDELLDVPLFVVDMDGKCQRLNDVEYDGYPEEGLFDWKYSDKNLKEKEVHLYLASEFGDRDLGVCNVDDHKIRINIYETVALDKLFLVGFPIREI